MKPRAGLVLTGGGARAAYQVGVVKAVRDLLGGPAANPFPILTGTSAGAINAATLAVFANDFNRGVANLLEVWENMRCEHIYRTDAWSIMKSGAKWLSSMMLLSRHNPVSLLDNAPLREMLQRNLDFSRIQQNIDSGALYAACITASGYSSGQSVSFFQGGSGLNGFFLQDTGDNDAATSDGVFVFIPSANPLASIDVAVSDLVALTGTVKEFNGLTEIDNVSALSICGAAAPVAPLVVELPEPTNGYLERYEGMLVTFPETLTVGQTFFLGRYGQITLSSEGRLFQPTNFIDAQDQAAVQAQEGLLRDIRGVLAVAQHPQPNVVHVGLVLAKQRFESVCIALPAQVQQAKVWIRRLKHRLASRETCKLSADCRTHHTFLLAH